MSEYRFIYRVTGPLFKSPDRATKKAVTQALATTTNEAKRQIKVESRVDTGRMRRNWTSEEISWKEFEIRNDVPYTTVWVGRGEMVHNQQLGFIEDRLIHHLGEELPRELNG